MKAWMGEPLRFNWRAVIVTVLSTLLIVVDAYYQITPIKAVDRLILYLLIPLVVVLLVFRSAPQEYGFGIGNWKVGIPLTILALVLVAPIGFFAARNPAMQLFYAAQAPGVPWIPFLDLIGWEFFFRGFLLWTYVQEFGAHGLWLQAVPFALAHVGKPPIETLSTIFGGFAFGWLAYRTRSFLYPFLVHWFLDSFVIMLAAGAMG